MPRKVLAGLFASACALVLGGAAVYLSAVLFLVLNKADPRQARLLSISHYWDLYANDPSLRQRLLFSLGASGFSLMVVIPAALAAAARQRRPLHGDARFASASEIARAGLLAGRANPGPAIDWPSEALRWWEVYGTCEWAAICRRQAERHLSGSEPSVELAVIGRRVCESEWDALLTLGLVEPC